MPRKPGWFPGPPSFREDSVSIIKLVRHGTSKANTGELDPQVVGDFRIPLADLGREQARAAGTVLGADFLGNALIYTSPYLRARRWFGQRNVQSVRMLALLFVRVFPHRSARRYVVSHFGSRLQ